LQINRKINASKICHTFRNVSYKDFAQTDHRIDTGQAVEVIVGGNATRLNLVTAWRPLQSVATVSGRIP